MEMFASFVSSRKSRIGRSRHHSKPNRDAALGLLANQFVADPWSATRVTLQYGTEMNASIDVLFAASTSQWAVLRRRYRLHYPAPPVAGGSSTRPRGRQNLWINCVGIKLPLALVSQRSLSRLATLGENRPRRGPRRHCLRCRCLRLYLCDPSDHIDGRRRLGRWRRVSTDVGDRRANGLNRFAHKA
jgi:hypothetical protein